MAEYPLVGECTDSYRVTETKDGIEIVIRVPKRFADLWIVKLGELRTTDEQIADFEPKESPLRLA